MALTLERHSSLQFDIPREDKETTLKRKGIIYFMTYYKAVNSTNLAAVEIQWQGCLQNVYNKTPWFLSYSQELTNWDMA
jgi:hypothetical protein